MAKKELSPMEKAEAHLEKMRNPKKVEPKKEGKKKEKK
jgi:hypothetical protein